MSYAHNKWTKQPFPSPAAVGGGAVALIVLVLAWLVLTETPERIRAPASMVPTLGTQAGAAAPPLAVSTPPKLVYRNSVLPGGVRSAAELAFALGKDPVASAHFAGFDVAAAHIVRVEKARLVHVSYRIGDKIYWTRNKVRLAAGEELLSDGTHLVRARCGNRIADEPQGLILDNEPAPEVLDALMVSADGLIDESAHMAAVGNAVLQAAASVEQPLPLRLASNVQVGTPLPVTSLRNPSGERTLTQLPPPVSVSTPVRVPSVPGSVGSPTPTPKPAQDIAKPAPGSPAQLPPGTTVGPQLPATPVPGLPAAFPSRPTAGPQLLTPPAAPTEIPEPGSAALAAVALAAVVLARRRARPRPAAHTQPR